METGKHGNMFKTSVLMAIESFRTECRLSRYFRISKNVRGKNR